MRPSRRSTRVLAATVSASIAVMARGVSAEPASDAGADVSTFDQLRTTDAPAFVILGVSPTEIQRPSTPRGLIASLGGFVADRGFAVPKDLAVEVAPYWLFPHPDLSITDYRGESLMRPLRTLSLSVGTTQTKRTAADATGMEHTDAHIAVGFRTMLVQAGPVDDCTAGANAAGLALAQSLVLSETEQTQLARAGAIGSPPYNAALASLIKARVDREFRTDQCVALVASTTGFSVDLAGALDVRALDSNLTRAATSLAGYSLWTDLAYDLPSVSVDGVVRVTSRKDDMSNHSLVDAGVRGIYKAKHYAVSVEALLRHRFVDGDATTYKLDAALEYQINSDTWLSLTFGKDFATAAGAAGSVFSLANIQWSIGKPSI